MRVLGGILTAAIIAVVSSAGVSARAAELAIGRSDGGTVLGTGKKAGEKSTLHKEWIVINDPTSPVAINQRTGIETGGSIAGQLFLPKGGSPFVRMSRPSG